jgi:hypothetical protein
MLGSVVEKRRVPCGLYCMGHLEVAFPTMALTNTLKVIVSGSYLSTDLVTAIRL